MAEGTISELRESYGFIEPAQSDKRVFFHRSSLEDARFNELQAGMVVDYEAEEGEKGIKATVVRVRKYRFLNPYNFVRYLEKPLQEPTIETPGKLLMWRCPPPPHDRYVGLTGRITCEVKAVTPLFVSDSHAIEGNVGEHRTYRFFQYNGQPALPASSLRGMFRSVFEAATNSCFMAFDGPRLEFRERPEYGSIVKNGAGIVKRLPESGNDGEITLCRIAKVGAYYEGKDQWKNVLHLKPNGQPWQCGDMAFARVKSVQQGYVVRELSTDENNLQPLNDGEEYVQGWLKITGKGGGSNKKNEFLFISPDECDSLTIVSFGKDEMDEYNFVLMSQQGRGNIPASNQSPKLSEGSLVWVEIEHKGKYRRAKRIVRVQVPRVPYKHTIGELLNSHAQHLERCKCYEALCPACRVFGWVRNNPPKGTDRVAYAGRVRFSHGKIDGEWQTESDIGLAILSIPKPTTTAFYLLNSDGQPDASVTYDTEGARLRGRKFYRHQSNPAEYKSSDMSDQNRTIRGALKQGTTFTFILDFESLAPLELGALLYALELEDGMFHSLGYAKPLGFGSIKVTVKSVQTIDWETRLQSVDLDAGWRIIDWAQYRKAFLKETQALYSDGFEKVVLADLRALLGAPSALPIHYPRPKKQLDLDHPQYEWFMGNKKRIEKHQANAVSLHLAEKDTEGLPLIEKDGKEGRR